jgi:thiamine kinase-like enzyme
MHDGERISTFCSSIIRIGDTVRKTFHDHCKYRSRWPAEAMLRNESKALGKFKGKAGIQQLIKVTGNTVVTAYAGHRLRKDDLSYVQAMAQGMAIVDRLERKGVVHRDIRPDNLVYRNSNVTLIDFAWAFFDGCIFKNKLDAPGAMGGRYRHPAIDDRYSMTKSINHIYGR